MKSDRDAKIKKDLKNIYYIIGLTIITCSLLLINTKSGEMYRPMFLGPITVFFAIGSLLNSIVFLVKNKEHENCKNLRKKVVISGLIPIGLIVVTVIVLAFRGSYPAE